MNRFTVVVPTRERADTLFHTLRTCLDQDYENLSVLVSDNCSTDHTAEVVQSFRDPRVRYVKTPARLSMSANWDFALEHVEDGFVNYIGDDDGIIPGSFQKLNQMLTEHPVDAVTSKDMAIYFWPGYVEEELRGNLSLSLKPTYHVMDTAHCFRKSVDQLNCIHLPQLYHGYVRTSLLRELKKKHGNFFNGSSPDIYAGVVLGKILNKHIFSEYPLTIHGLSQHSIGSSNVLSNLNKNPFEKFWTENNIPFHEKLVRSPSTTIIYADAFLLARKYIDGMPDIDIKKVIRKTLQEAAGRQKHNFQMLMETVRKIGEINNLSAYAEEEIAKVKPPVPFQEISSYGLNPVNEILTIKTTQMGMQNVYDASVFCKNILGKKVYPYYDRPLNESAYRYFKRGVKNVVKKITG